MNPKYQDTQPTAEPLDWAELVTLDLSLLEQPNGLEKLSEELKYAANHVGFFYVQSSDISKEEVDRQFEIAQGFFSLPLKERLPYFDREKYMSGQNIGYRPITWRQPVNGVHDNTQIYSIPAFDGHHIHHHPEVVARCLEEIQQFQVKCDKIVQQLLQILEHVLELPPFALRKKIRANASSEQQLRYMHYAARNPEENTKMGHIYAGGHTDLGVLTLLFRQPVAGLQIQNAEGEWRWVQPRDDALTVNICDALSMISCKHLKSTIHRVHAPPADQRHLDRIGVLYFGRFSNDEYLDPLVASGVLQRTGELQTELSKKGIRMTMGEYAAVRGAQHSRRKQPLAVSEDGRFEWDQRDLAVTSTLSVQYYN